MIWCSCSWKSTRSLFKQSSRLKSSWHVEMTLTLLSRFKLVRVMSMSKFSIMSSFSMLNCYLLPLLDKEIEFSKCFYFMPLKISWTSLIWNVLRTVSLWFLSWAAGFLSGESDLWLDLQDLSTFAVAFIKSETRKNMPCHISPKDFMFCFVCGIFMTIKHISPPPKLKIHGEYTNCYFEMKYVPGMFLSCFMRFTQWCTKLSRYCSQLCATSNFEEHYHREDMMRSEQLHTA